MGFANFYRGFVNNFANISTPLHNMTKKGAPFQWKEEKEKAFQKLKRLFNSAPVLAMWQENRQTILETDASGWATGDCLSQIDSTGKIRPIAYYSKKLSPAESNYNVHDKELLAIIRCHNEWRA